MTRKDNNVRQQSLLRRNNNNNIRRCSCHFASNYRSMNIILFLSLLLHTICYISTNAYPVMVQVDESSSRCFRFNIPEDDDAHLVALTIPNEDEVGGDETLEIYYTDFIYKLTKLKNKHMIIPKELPEGQNELPTDVAQKKSTFLQQYNDKSDFQVQITGTPTTNPKNYQYKYQVSKYFQPIVVNYVGRIIDAKLGRRAKIKDPADNANLEGYGVCLTNLNTEKQIQLIFDIVLVSEEVLDVDGETEKGGTRFEKDKHLTPLEQSLDQSIAAANSVLREMKYMEKREQRMRKTAESINSRVRWFSYLSVSVLLSVTYIQVTYLKRYFHKKKLM